MMTHYAVVRRVSSLLRGVVVAALVLSAFSASGQVLPPVIAKSFSPASIPVNGTSTLTVTITNPAANAVALTGLSFTDTLPSGIVYAVPSGLAATCGGVAVAAFGPPATLSLSGGSVAANSSCTVTANVTAAAANSYVNVTGAVSSTNGGTGNTATATLVVAAPPGIAKSFTPSSIAPNGTSMLTVTLTNPNGVDLTGVNFADTLPAGMVYATPSGLAASCGGVAVAAFGPPATLSLSGGTVPANGSCTVSANVTASAPGQYVNVTGAVSAANGGTGNTATATLTVATAPTIAKSFDAQSAVVGARTTLTFVLSNPVANVVPQTGVGFTDPLPTGLVVDSPNGVVNTCGGTVTAVPGSSSVSLSGGTIAVAGSCTVTVNLTVVAVGTLVNVTGPVSSTNGGPGNVATATIVATPRVIPTLSGIALALLGLLLAGATAVRLRARD